MMIPLESESSRIWASSLEVNEGFTGVTTAPIPIMPMYEMTNSGILGSTRVI